MSGAYNLSSVPGLDELVRTGMNGSTTSLLLNMVVCRSNDSMYKVIRYDKDVFSTNAESVFGLCRSVIVNSTNDVVGFSPPKSIPADVFIQKYPDVTKSHLIAEEFVEGTMINVFFDPSVGDWEISTRSIVGATSCFYKTPNQKTFRQMFVEAAQHCALDIHRLNKDFSYSFVLQHPENRIVIPFKVPQLYLVAAYKITKKEETTWVEYYHSHEMRSHFKDTQVQFPRRYTSDSYSGLIQQFASMNTPYDVMGVVLYNSETGERSKIRNPVYEQVRELRGNQPKLQYQYLSLRKEGKVKEFLKYYPEYKKEFSEFRDKVHIFTNALYSNYVDCYIKKTKPLVEYVPEYKNHMYHLHTKYINELREKKQFVTQYVVQQYVNQLHPSVLMYSLNYPLRTSFRL